MRNRAGSARRCGRIVVVDALDDVDVIDVVVVVVVVAAVGNG